MLRMDRAHVWAWDARPWPDFPNRVGQWSDGVNFGTGHWISGRQEMAVLADVVREVCARSGVTAVETGRLFGGVAGMEMRDGQSARSGLQPLMLAYGFDCRERDGVLHFFTRDGLIDLDLTGLDPVEESGPHKVRGALDEQPDRVRLRYIQSDHDYQGGSVEAAIGAGAPMRAETADLPVALGAGQAKGIAERWLAEALVSRDGIQVGLPPSLLAVEAGDVIKLDGARWRIDRIEERGTRKVEGVRVEPGVYVAADHPDRLFDLKAVSGIGPVLAELLDLPLLRGDEVDHAPYVAAASTPWPGPVNVFLSPSDSGYELAGQVVRQATIGTLDAPLSAGRAGVWSGGVLRVELSHGALEGHTAEAVLDGANIAALRTGQSGDWEVIQYRDAVLVGPKIWELRGLLRGQAGTEFAIPEVWPVGTRFVALDGAAVQIDLPLSARGLARYVRIGAASRAVDDASYHTRVEAFAGVGLRPYAPVHLRGVPAALGGLVLSWTRRTRIDGDVWSGGDVPLNEEREAYLVEIEKAGAVLTSFEVSGPVLTLASGDLPAAPYDITVGQISARFGIGPKARMTRHE